MDLSHVIRRRIIAILKGKFFKKRGVRTTSFFHEFDLSFEGPVQLCMELSDKLGVPSIHSNFVRQIPSNWDFQDPYPCFKRKCVKENLTVGGFADKLASWLLKNNPELANTLTSS